MKRCPQCDFVYFDTDEMCDLDGAKLVQVADSELAFNEATNGQQSSARSKSRSLLRALAGGLLLGALLFSVYWVFARRQQPQVTVLPRTIRTVQPIKIAPLPTPQYSPSPRETPFIPPNVSQVDQTKRIAMSKDPVSTSTNEKATGPIWIKLSNGAHIEADEVWRTKEGVWYRRNGVVTLIKANRVKGVEKAK